MKKSRRLPSIQMEEKKSLSLSRDRKMLTPRMFNLKRVTERKTELNLGSLAVERKSEHNASSRLKRKSEITVGSGLMKRSEHSQSRFGGRKTEMNLD